VLSDGLLANGAEPFRIPALGDLPRIATKLHLQAQSYKPYQRDACLARPWAIPGLAGMEHRIGGLEKEDVLGRVSHDGSNHERMCQLRAEKVQRVADFYPPTEVFGDASGELLVIGWGSTFGAIREGIGPLRKDGRSIGHVHLRHVHPLPNDLAEIMQRFDKVLVPEMNSGQLALLLRAKYLMNVRSVTKLQGKPFKQSDISAAVASHL
jgi:2-oxoglutarate/2-oxoacid ferredoxin oxidoreductase subunit alpha